MALQLSVTQFGGGKLTVGASNFSGNKVVIIDHIIVSVDWDGSTWHTWHYQEDFYSGSGRVPAGWGGPMLVMDYGVGPAKVHATAAFWEVDRTVKSPTTKVS